MVKFIINKKKEFLFTYASDYLGALSCKKIFKFFTEDLGNDWEVVVAKEHGDKAHNHDHFHVYAKYIGEMKDGFTTRNQKYFYIPLDFNVIKIFNFEEPEIKEPFIYEREQTLLNIGRSYTGSVWNIIDNAIKQVYGFAEWKVIDTSMYFIKFKGKRYGPECASTINMIKYVTKNPIEEVLSNFDWKNRIEELKKSDEGKKKYREPDWVDMKKKGMTANEALEYIKTNFTREYFKFWYKWESPFYKYFCENKEDFEINPDAEYWIPIEVKKYFDEVYMPYFEHKEDREWLRKHRLDRPGSLVWIGDSQKGKTTVVRSLFVCNYYHTLIDGMIDFDENAPCVVLDDFHVNLKKYLPSWKCWLGCQTNFTVNPKYGKRRKINWGHPCIFLNNDDFRECKESPEKMNTIWNKTDLDYIKTNCTFVNTGSHELWKEPIGMEKFKYVKIKISDLRPELKNKPDQCDCGDCSLCWARIDNASEIEREEESGNSYVFLDSDEENKENKDPNLPRHEKTKRKIEFELGQLSPIRKNRRNTL